MNRNYSKDGLLKMYQQEAINTRDRKQQEKQNRVMEERKTLDLINREIDQERRNTHNQKQQRINQRQEEYNQMLVRQQEDKESNPNWTRFKGKSEFNGTFKIGGENREIKIKNYDDISNHLVLNPTREVITNEVRGRSERENRDARVQQRGKSQGYNIINHSHMENNSNNIPIPNNQYQSNNSVSNINSQNYPGKYPNPNQYNSVNIQERDYRQETQPIDHLENYPYGGDRNPNHNPNPNQNVEQEYEDPEFQKYYEEYLRQKLREEEEALKQMPPQKSYPPVGIGKNPNEIPTSLDEYEAYRNQKLNEEISSYNNLPNNYVL
jgi:hypothetical protein